MLIFSMPIILRLIKTSTAKGFFRLTTGSIAVINTIVEHRMLSNILHHIRLMNLSDVNLNVALSLI